MFDRKQMHENWEQEHKKTSWKGPFSIEPILKYLRKDQPVLDIGCGKGRYLIPLVRKGYKITGCDIALSPLKEIKQRHTDFDAIACEISNLPFKTGAFEAVLCFGVLQHLWEAERKLAVREIHRVIKPEGLLFLEVPGVEDMRYGGEEVEKNTFQRKSGILYHYFTSSGIKELVGDFEVIRIEERKTEKQFRGEKYVRHFIFAIVRALPQ